MWILGEQSGTGENVPSSVLVPATAAVPHLSSGANIVRPLMADVSSLTISP
jgi:hypothetical protein